MIETGGKIFVIDTGPDFRQQMLRENVKRLDAVIFTHAHKDHIAGFDDIRAFNYVLKKKIDVYADDIVQQAIHREFSYIFEKVKYPGVPEINLHAISNKDFTIEGIKFTPIRLLHHKLPVLGFRVGDFTYITDANFISEEEKQKVKGSKIIVLNALRKEPHLSHFSFDQAIELMKELNPGKGYFTHISHQLGLHREVEAELPDLISPAYDRLTLEL